MLKRFPKLTALNGLKAMSKMRPMKGLPKSTFFKDYNAGLLVERHLNHAASCIKPTSRPGKRIRWNPQPAKPKPPKKLTQKQYFKQARREIRQAIRMAQSGIIRS